jgi:hypothetical protein
MRKKRWSISTGYTAQKVAQGDLLNAQFPEEEVPIYEK